MARTGLRMMPTFPSPSLKFRTLGFPQYGLKASISGGTCLQTTPVKPAPGIPAETCSLSPPFARVCDGASCRALSPDRPTRSRAAAREASPLYPRGPWLAPEFCCLARSSLTPTPSVSPTGTQRFHGLAVYTLRLSCAGAPRRPTGPSLLSPPFNPGVPSTIRRWVRGAVPLPVRTPMPGFLALSPSRHPRVPASASNIRRGVLFDAASFALCCGPSVCLALLTGSGAMRSRAPHPTF
jgi:hypothetical protein